MSWDLVGITQGVVGTCLVVFMVSCGVQVHNADVERRQIVIQQHKCKHTGFAGSRGEKLVYTCENGVYLEEQL